jgi:hypothetical protein
MKPKHRDFHWLRASKALQKFPKFSSNRKLAWCHMSTCCTTFQFLRWPVQSCQSLTRMGSSTLVIRGCLGLRCVIFFLKSTTLLTKMNIFFTFKKYGICLKKIVSLKKNTTPPTQTHLKTNLYCAS